MGSLKPIRKEPSMTIHDPGSGRQARSVSRPPRRMSPERRREHLINTALRLYSQRPPEDVSIDDIVTEADVSRALFYRYFSNVRDVHVAALTNVVDELVNRVILPADGDFREQLASALSEFVTFVEAYSSGYTALMRSGSTIATSDTGPLIDRVRDHVADLMCDRLGLTRPAPMVLMTIRGWISLVETTLLTWLAEADLPRGQLEPWLIDQLLAMSATTMQHDPKTAQQIGQFLN